MDKTGELQMLKSQANSMKQALDNIHMRMEKLEKESAE
jgi:hypothetical protein